MINKFLYPEVSIINMENEEPIKINENKFVPVEKLFPCWMAARVILTRFCEETEYFEVNYMIDNPSQIDISPKIPLWYDELSKEMVPSIHFFPPEEIPEVEKILNQITCYYTPKDLDKYLYEKVTLQLMNIILHDIKNCENKIIQCGGRSFKDELYFRFGIRFC